MVHLFPLLVHRRAQILVAVLVVVPGFRRPGKFAEGTVTKFVPGNMHGDRSANQGESWT